MRRLTLLVALMLPLVSVALTSTPTAAACTPPLCTLKGCTFILERPTVDPETFEFDPGLVGVDCTFDDLPKP